MDATMSSGPFGLGVPLTRFTDGLTLNGTLTAEGLRGYTATLGFTGSQTVDGTGTIQLVEKKDGGTRGQAAITVTNVDSTTTEHVIFGEDITLAGSGNINARSSSDSLSILGTVRAKNGAVKLDDIDNGGAAMSIDASAGTVSLLGARDTVFNAAGTDAGALTLVTGGTGIDLTVNMDATMSSGPSVGSASYTFTDGLTLNGTLTAEGLRGYTATLGFTGSQTVDGTGTIQLVEKKDDGTRGQAGLTFNGEESGSEEILRIGSGVSFTGSGEIDASSGDLIVVEGNVSALGGEMKLSKEIQLLGDLSAAIDGKLTISGAHSFSESSVTTISVGYVDGVAQSSELNFAKSVFP